MSDESIIAIRTASDVASIYGLAVYQILSELKRIGIDVGRNDALEKSSTLSLIDLYESKKIPCKVINVRQMYLNWLSSHDGIVFELQVKETIRQNIIENEWDKERRNKIDEERRIKFEKDRKESQRKDHKESERLEKKYKSNGGLVKLSMAIDLCADALGPNFVCNIIHECLSKRLIEIVLNKENIEIENIKLSLFLKFNYILCVKENHDYFFWSKLDREGIRNLEKLGVVSLQLKLKNQSLSQGFYDIKSRYSLSDYSSIELSTESLLRIIFKQIRGKNYTSAMLEIIFFLLSASFVREFEGKNVDVVKSLFPLISSIFIETNKMDLVFKLNTIDTSALGTSEKLPFCATVI